MQRIVFWLTYPLLWILSKLPFWLFYKVSDVVCFIVYRLIGYRTKTVRYNLELAFPEKSKEERKKIERRFYSHMCDMFMEMVKSISITEKQIRERFVFKGVEKIQAIENRNQSVILILGHYASYEWMNILQFQMNHTGYGIYKKIKSEPFDALVHRIRARWDSKVLENKLAPKIMARHKAEGIIGTYGFVADQSPKQNKNNHFVSFFDHEVPFFTGVERIAKNLDIPVLFLDVQKKGRGFYEASFEIITENPKSVPDYEITDVFAKKLEAQIKNAPEYYLWTHKRFKHMKGK